MLIKLIYIFYFQMGSLDLNEFTKLIREVTPGLKDYEIQCVFNNFDLNDDKFIDFEEFK